MKIQNKASNLLFLLAAASLDSFASAGNLDLRDGSNAEFVSGLGDLYGEENSSISVVLKNGSEKTFHKTGNPNAGTSSIGWSGQSGDGSDFTFVTTIEGYNAGSLVDMERDEITQWSSGPNGDNKIVTVTPSSDFPPEQHPLNEDGTHAHGHARSLAAAVEEHGPIAAHATGYYADADADADDTSNLRDHGGQADYQQEGRKLTDDGSILDVMVVWTKKAECRTSNKSAGCTVTDATFNTMKAHMELAVTETNDAYTSSGVQTQLRLVHFYREENYVESSFSDSLSHVRGTNDGFMDDVHTKRTQFAADIVALIIDDSQYCGVAYIGPSKSLMFSVTAWNCATGYYSFGHEIGHNQGCLHDRGTSNACNSGNYNYGFRDPQAGFRSILAYSCRSGQCDNNQGGGCTRVKMFSNPNNQYNGKPIGNAQNDNRRQINDVRVEIAQYYESKPPGSPTPAPTPAPTDAPTSKPTRPPVTSPPTPSVQCKDSRALLWYKKNKKSCSEVKNFCSDYKINLSCPKTCGSCEYGHSDAVLPFYLSQSGKTKWNCMKVFKLSDDKKRSKCSNARFSNTCRATCKNYM